MTIKDIYNKYDHLIIHGTRLLGGGGGNKCIDRNASVAKRIELTLKNTPTICCSSFKNGEGLKNIFAPVGLFLCDGNIRGAGEFDLGSWVNEDCSRDFDSPNLPIEDQVDNAITKKILWNEFIVDNHKPIGIYLCFDDIHYLSQQIQRFYDFYNETKTLGLAYFIIESGNLFEAKYDEINNIFTKERSITIKDAQTNYSC
jgi:hypothetical protein